MTNDVGKFAFGSLFWVKVRNNGIDISKYNGRNWELKILKQTNKVYFPFYATLLKGHIKNKCIMLYTFREKHVLYKFTCRSYLLWQILTNEGVIWKEKNMMILDKIAL